MEGDLRRFDAGKVREMLLFLWDLGKGRFFGRNYKTGEYDGNRKIMSG